MNLFEWRYGDFRAIFHDVSLLLTALMTLIAAWQSSRGHKRSKDNGRKLEQTSQKVDAVLVRTNGILSSIRDTAYQAGYHAGVSTVQPPRQASEASFIPPASSNAETHEGG